MSPCRIRGNIRATLTFSFSMFVHGIYTCIFYVNQALKNEERAKKLENELFTYQGEHSHTDTEVMKL